MFALVDTCIAAVLARPMHPPHVIYRDRDCTKGGMSGRISCSCRGRWRAAGQPWRAAMIVTLLPRPGAVAQSTAAACTGRRAASADDVLR